MLAHNISIVMTALATAFAPALYMSCPLVKFEPCGIGKTGANESSSLSYDTTKIVQTSFGSCSSGERVQSGIDTDFLELRLDGRHTNSLTQEESNRCVYNEVDESRDGASDRHCLRDRERRRKNKRGRAPKDV